MTKMIRTALLVAVMMLTISAQAQVKLGVKGGLSVSDVRVSGDIFKADNRLGYFIGPTLKVSFPGIGLGFDVSALYEQREARLTETAIKAHSVVKQQQVSFPLNTRYSIGLGRSTNIFFFAGPQFSFNVGDKTKSIINRAAEWRLKTSNFSVNAGAGATVLSQLQLSIHYNIACGKTGEVTMDSGTFRFDSHNNAWQLALAYFF